jgi:hypothetical protein
VGHFQFKRLGQVAFKRAPRGIEDIRPGLDRMSLPELDEMISDRASRVTYYQTIIKTAKENAKLLSKEIEAVVRSRSSN